MKKNPRNYKRGGEMFAYILDSVYSDVIDTESMTDKERIEFLLDTFFEEKCKYDRSGMCTFDLLREWLQGLPSAISVAFYYSDIAAALGVFYVGALWYVLSSTIIGRRFCVDLYKATLHLERLFV